MTAPGPESAIGEEDFLKFQEFFYRKTGIMFGEGKRYFVDKRLVERIRVCGLGGFREYFNMMRFQASGEELQHLVNVMTVNETYFYREEYQFRCLVNSILAEIARKRRPGERIRIWSVPCSTGEEPYSLALYLLENWSRVDDYDIEIVASDIDTNVLAAARDGIYGERSLQNLTRDAVARFFTPLGDGRWRISPQLRGSIDFTCVNVADRAQMRGYRGFDVIFCRNLLIYFNDLSRRQAAEAFFDALSPGGYICLGHSESMSRISSLFTVRKFADAIVYQKPAEGEAA